MTQQKRMIRHTCDRIELGSARGAGIMVEAFEVDEQARLIPADEYATHTDSHKVLVFVDHDNKVVYLWRGKKATFMTKLMGTRVAARLSHSYPDYRVRPISEDYEPAAFLALIGMGHSLD